MSKYYQTSIIILNWNGLEDTRNCLKSVLKVKPDNFKIIVVDNGSKDNQGLKIQKEFKSVDVVLLNQNYGFTGGVNRGIKYSKEKYSPEYYLLLNNDTEVDPEFLHNLINETSDKKIGMASPIIYNFYEREKVWFAGGKINWWLAKPHHLYDLKKLRSKTIDQEYLTGCCLLIKKDVINKIGLLDNDFFAYFEDVAYSLTARKADFRCVLVPSSRIYHIQAASTGRSGKFNTYLVARNRILFVYKYSSLLYRLYFTFFNFTKLIFVLFHFFITNQNQRVNAYFQGYINGTLGKGGNPTI